MILIVWIVLSALALGFNVWGLHDARTDLCFLLRRVGNGRLERRLIVARAHVREEMIMVWTQTVFLLTGILRVFVGPVPTPAGHVYRLVTALLFLSVQAALVVNSIEKRRYRKAVIRAKRQMLRESQTQEVEA